VGLFHSSIIFHYYFDIFSTIVDLDYLVSYVLDPGFNPPSSSIRSIPNDNKFISTPSVQNFRQEQDLEPLP
jgi:hypothetical protein